MDINSYKPGHHSEEAEFLHQELRLAVVPMAKVVDEKASKEEMNQMLQILSNQIENLPSKEDVKAISDYIQNQFSSGDMNDLVTSLNILEERLTQLSVDLQGLADRVTALES